MAKVIVDNTQQLRDYLEMKEKLKTFPNRQYFIGVTLDGQCVRCLYIRLFTGRYWVSSDERSGKEYTNNVFILERGYEYQQVVRVK